MIMETMLDGFAGWRVDVDALDYCPGCWRRRCDAMQARIGTQPTRDYVEQSRILTPGILTARGAKGTVCETCAAVVCVPPRAVEIAGLVERLVRTVGPVSFRSLVWFVRQQGPDDAADHEVAAALTVLIRLGTVALYDDGVSFTVGRP